MAAWRHLAGKKTFVSENKRPAPYLLVTKFSESFGSVQTRFSFNGVSEKRPYNVSYQNYNGKAKKSRLEKQRILPARRSGPAWNSIYRR
jgi:predicted kinase